MLKWKAKPPLLCRLFGHKWGDLLRSPYTVYTHWQDCERKGCTHRYEYYFDARKPKHRSTVFQAPSPDYQPASPEAQAEWNEMAAKYREGES